MMYTHYNLTDYWPSWEQSHNHHKVDSRVEETHKYNIDMVGLWDIGEYTGNPGDLVLGKIKSKLLNTGCIVPKYQIEVLSEGLYNGRVITVSEKNALEEIDPTPYLPLDTSKPGIDEPSVNAPVKNSNPFTCDIEELKTDISDLRTDINSLLESQYKLEGDILVAKQPEIELSLAADDSGIPIKEEVDRLDSNVKDIEDQIQDIKKRQNKSSKLSKLALLSRLL